MSIVDNARRIAHEAHKGQMRKWSENTPYIVHPEECAEKARSLQGVDDVDVAAALLHDVVEDCGDQWKEVIEKECGADVLALVMELTFPTEGAEWAGKPRAEKNVIRFAQMRRMTLRAKRLKMIDTWHNLKSMGNAPYKLVRKTVDEAYERLDILKDADEQMAVDLKEMIDRVAKRK
jgi:GTP diphosphokinase / guanosine-3',5'-bis(diphosphate) 3'-diphosphatase